MMNNRFTLLITIGFILSIIGGFMETQALELGDFVSGFGTGILAVGVFQFIYKLIQKRKVKQTT